METEHDREQLVASDPRPEALAREELAARASQAKAAHGDWLKQDLMAEAETIIDILLAKRHDYGTLNIKITGRYGLAVRMQDKVSRLLNLSRPGAGIPHVPESRNDTYRDLAGYALIGLVGKGWDLE